MLSVCTGLRCILVWAGQDKQLGLRDVTVSEDKSLGSMSVGLREATAGGVSWGWEQTYSAGEIYTQC